LGWGFGVGPQNFWNRPWVRKIPQKLAKGSY
jgi:hypothetical protein